MNDFPFVCSSYVKQEDIPVDTYCKGAYTVVVGLVVYRTPEKYKDDLDIYIAAIGKV